MNNLIYKQTVIDAMNRLREDDLVTYGVEIPESFDAERANEVIRNLPTIDTIEGYPIEHLLFIARALNEANLTPKYLAEKLNDAYWVSQIMIQETMDIIIKGRGKVKGMPLSVNRCRDS